MRIFIIHWYRKCNLLEACLRHVCSDVAIRRCFLPMHVATRKTLPIFI